MSNAQTLANLVSSTGILTDGTISSTELSDTVGIAKGGTGQITGPAAITALEGYTTTATTNGTTILTVNSTLQQYFTGVSTQTVRLPVTSTLATGWSYYITNNSTNNLTVTSSGANTVCTVIPGTAVMVTCILASGTTAASWDFGFNDFASVTGTGSVVLATSPTLVTPALGTPASGNLTNCTADGTVKVGFRNIPSAGTDKTGAYTLAVGDIGEFVSLGTAGSIVVPATTFTAGDVIMLYNNTTANITITCSAVTAYIGGVNTARTSVTLATRGICNIFFYSASVCVITGNVV